MCTYHIENKDHKQYSSKNTLQANSDIMNYKTDS